MLWNIVYVSYTSFVRFIHSRYNSNCTQLISDVLQELISLQGTVKNCLVYIYSLQYMKFVETEEEEKLKKAAIIIYH